MSNYVLENLQARGYVEQTSNLAAIEDLLSKKTVIYQGFDPTKPSLHVGHLLSLMVFNYLQNAGQKMIFILGGGTALIGDPAGKNSSRPMISNSEIINNKEAIKSQVQKMGLIDFEFDNNDRPMASMLDNIDWLDMGLLEFLRSITPHFSVNEMSKRETFRQRLDSQENLSLLEFLYPTLQGYDFLYLYEKYNCQIQVGGNDQWSNILDGISLVRKKHHVDVYALTFPLLLDQSGNKMGKTSTGQTIWLSSEGLCSTSVFDFYQYWLKTPDSDIQRCFKLLTFLEFDEIESIISKDPRMAQRRLAFEITKIVHGEVCAITAENDSKKAFGNVEGLPVNIPFLSIKSDSIVNGDLEISRLLSASDIVKSLSAAKRLIQQGGVYLNGIKVSSDNQSMNLKDFRLLDGEQVALIRYGKGKVLRIVLVDN